jgi:hypothetical protein
VCGALLLVSIGFAPAIGGAQTRETPDPSARPTAAPVPTVRADGTETDKQDHRCGRLDLTAAPEQSTAASQTAAADRPPKVTNVSGRLELFHCITVKVDNLDKLLRDANGDLSKIVLHLDGYPVQGLPVRRVSVGGQASDELQYDIARLRTAGTPRADDAETSWTSLLAAPRCFRSRHPATCA